jgi:hypothetical protein
MNKKTGSAGSATAPVEAEEALEAVDDKSGEVSEGSGSQVERAKAKAEAAKVPPLKPPEEEEKKARTSWIEVELVNELGEPMPFESVEIITPNGRVTTTLDENGLCRIDEIEKGSCEISFTRLDKEAWIKKAGGGGSSEKPPPDGRAPGEKKQEEEPAEDPVVPDGGSNEPEPGGDSGGGEEQPAEKKEKPKIEITGKEKTSEAAVAILELMLQQAGLLKATITSGVRTSADQARIMYDNIKQHGVPHQKALYGAGGDKVIDVYVDNQSSPRADVIALMQAKIDEIGPSKVSKHCSNTHDVFDVAPSSITDKPAFEDAIKHAKEQGWISHYILPPGDPAYHIEIKK